MELTTTPTAGTPPFAAVVRMFYEPTQTFKDLEPRKHAWLPLVLVVLMSIVVTFWYFSVVDLEWFKEQMLSTMKASERALVEDKMSANTFKVSIIGTQLVGMPIIAAILGLYFMIAGKLTKNPMSFSTGFALGAWAYLPSILMLPLAAIQILMSSNPQFDMGALNMLSVNQLFFQYPMNHPLGNVYNSISVLSVWTTILGIIGFQVWGKASRATAIAVVLVPTVAIYGLWILSAMGSAAA